MDATTEPAPAEPAPAEPAPAEPAPAEAPMKTEPAPAEAPIKSERAPAEAPIATTPAMSSAPLCAIQNLWDTLATPAGTARVSRVHEFHYKQCFGPCIVRVSVSTGIFCLTNLLAEVQARIASLARGKKRKADEP